MKYWETFSRPPESALKTIKGGRLSGMTDINPMWRYQVMTETFGPCGIGWKFDILDLWLEPVSNEEVLAFAKINLFIKDDEKWSEARPGVGGSKMIASEIKGPHNNDECYKMSVTDALGTAMKLLGLGADIYAGLWDGGKYIDTPDNGAPAKTVGETKPVVPKSEYSKICKEYFTKYGEKCSIALYEFGKGEYKVAKDIPPAKQNDFIAELKKLDFEATVPF